MERKFNDWLLTFRGSISDYKYYVNFEKVYENINKMKIELSILNSLIGTNNFDDEFREICKKYPNTLKCIPILLAVRQYEIEVQTKYKNIKYNFSLKNNELNHLNIDVYLEFLKETGLKDLIQNHVINNLIDYVTGVEVGLDSNGRKNRGGHLMENLLESYIQELNVEYYKEMYTSDIEKKWHIDLSPLTNAGDVAKRFDFVVKTEHQIYVFETNFYKSGGSKLNETARSYKNITQEIEKIDGVTFIWITDGQGWKSAKHNLKETFDVLDTLFNIKDLEKGILKKVIR